MEFCKTLFEVRFSLGNEGIDCKDLSSQTRRGSPRRPSTMQTSATTRLNSNLVGEHLRRFYDVQGLQICQGEFVVMNGFCAKTLCVNRNFGYHCVTTSITDRRYIPASYLRKITELNSKQINIRSRSFITVSLPTLGKD